MIMWGITDLMLFTLKGRLQVDGFNLIAIKSSEWISALMIGGLEWWRHRVDGLLLVTGWPAAAIKR